VRAPMPAKLRDALSKRLYSGVRAPAARRSCSCSCLVRTEVFVLRNIRTLLDTARRVRSGDLGARTGLHDGKDELSQVGRDFDEMAETLQRQDLELKTAMQELQEQVITIR